MDAFVDFEVHKNKANKIMFIVKNIREIVPDPKSNF